MATDKRAAKRELEKKMMTRQAHQRDLEAYRKEGDAAGEEQCERALKIDDALIRDYCAEYSLELPHDVPPEEAA